MFVRNHLQTVRINQRKAHLPQIGSCLAKVGTIKALIEASKSSCRIRHVSEKSATTVGTLGTALNPRTCTRLGGNEVLP